MKACRVGFRWHQLDARDGSFVRHIVEAPQFCNWVVMIINPEIKRGIALGRQDAQGRALVPASIALNSRSANGFLSLSR